MNYKTIGNTLTNAEFNTIQYLLNKNMSKTIPVNLGETEVITEYGTLQLTFGTKHYKRKNGFITNSLKMRIVNPLIENMDYTIQLRYKTINDDLLDNDDTNDTTITYNLPSDTEVTITEATLDHIINNSAELTITFNKPLVQKAKSIILNGTEFWIESEETQNVTATILANTTPISNVKVSFSTEGTTTTETTNTDGIATYTYTGQEAGKLDYTVSYEGLTETFTIYDSFFHNGTFFNASNRITKITNPDNSVTLQNSTNTIGFYLADLTGTATNYAQCLQFDAPFTLLLKIQGFTGASRLQLYDGNDSHTQQLRLRTFETTNNPFIVRVDVYEDKIEYFVNGEKREDLTWIGEMGTCRAGLRLDAGAKVTYKDIYMSDITAIPITPVDTVTLSANPSSITIGGSTSLTATVTLEDENPGVGRSVSFFDGDTLVGSSVTDSDGIASFNYAPASVGECTLTAVCGGVESSSVTVTVNKITSTISLTGSNVTYPSNVSLTGTLSAGSGKSVKIYQGDTLIDTVTTGTGGAFSKTVTGLNAGSYTFKAVFDGDTQYSSVTSSDKSITVSKATPTISLATSSDTVDVGETFTLSGALSVGSGESVKIYQGDTLIDTLTTGTDGAYSKSITPSVTGTYTYKAVFEATTNYNSVTSTTVTVTVGSAPTPVPASISVSSDKNILSYADTESATITATVLDANSQPCEGETVTFTFKHDSTTVETQTATTNSSGVATVSYSSKGAGDLNINSSVRSLVSETYSVEDCIFYHPDAISYTGTSTSDTVYSLGYDEIADLSSTDFEMTWTFRQTSYGCDICLGASSEFSVSPIKSNYRVFIGNSGSGNTRHGYRTTTTTNTGGSTSGEVSLNTDHTMKIVKTGTTFSYYFNDVLMGTKTVSFWSNYNMFGVHTVQWNKGTTTISNLKIKPL